MVGSAKDAHRALRATGHGLYRAFSLGQEAMGSNCRAEVSEMKEKGLLQWKYSELSVIGILVISVNFNRNCINSFMKTMYFRLLISYEISQFSLLQAESHVRVLSVV